MNKIMTIVGMMIMSLTASAVSDVRVAHFNNSDEIGKACQEFQDTCELNRNGMGFPCASLCVVLGKNLTAQQADLYKQRSGNVSFIWRQIFANQNDYAANQVCLVQAFGNSPGKAICHAPKETAFATELALLAFEGTVEAPKIEGKSAADIIKSCVRQKVESIQYALGASYQRANASIPSSLLKVFPALNSGIDAIQTTIRLAYYPSIYASEIRLNTENGRKLLDQAKDNLTGVQAKILEIESCL
jgi:hypothetical protein